MRKLIAENVLTEIRYDHAHRHPLGATVGHVVVATTLTEEATIRRDLAVVDHYGKALELAQNERDRVADMTAGYAVVESVYVCGCRSDGPYYARQTA